MARQSASIKLAAAAAAAQDKPKKPLEELIPEYLLPYQQLFDNRASERMPPTQPFDHTIELLPDFQPQDCKVYPLSTDEHRAGRIHCGNFPERLYMTKMPQAHCSPSTGTYLCNCAIHDTSVFPQKSEKSGSLRGWALLSSKLNLVLLAVCACPCHF